MTCTTVIDIINRNDTRRHIVVMTCGNTNVVPFIERFLQSALMKNLSCNKNCREGYDIYVRKNYGFRHKNDE
jgi:hypothetical protein